MSEILSTKEKPKPFICKCGGCGKELRLLKDSREGQEAICGDCWNDK